MNKEQVSNFAYSIVDISSTVNIGLIAEDFKPFI